MRPTFDPNTFARLRQTTSTPGEASRRQHIRSLQQRVTELRGQLAAATAMYAITLSPNDLVRQQMASMALDRALHQLRRLSTGR